MHTHKSITSAFKRIKKLQRMCGTYAIAKHLKARGVSLNDALILLARKG